MDKIKKRQTSIKSASADISDRKQDKVVRSSDKTDPCFPENFTAHKFKRYRKVRGALVKSMREKRKLSQEQMGISARTIRRLESGQTAQVSMMDLLARLVPCPRELAKFLRNILEALPVACVKCRAVCSYQGLDNPKLIYKYCEDVTMLPEFDDDEPPPEPKL